MIGLSLSFCVRDIAEGKVNLSDVEVIMSGTKYESDEQFESVIHRYRQVYWPRNPDQCEAIARQLKAENKIEQPRLDGRVAYVGQTHWVNDKENIEWIVYNKNHST